MNRLRFKSFVVSLMLVLISFSLVVAQQPKTKAEIRQLVANSNSTNPKTSDDAREALSKLDARSLPPLVSILKKGNPCEQVAAAHYILKLDPKNMDIVPTMTDVTQGASLRTLFHLQEEMICRRAAAYVLALSADGIPVLTRLLKEGDSWERQTTIFALDDLTESSNYPEGSIPAMKELIPEIAKATKAKDRVLREMADEVLGQIARGPNAELSALAKRYH
ncbi:MAG TPA: hypothetical protein VF088_15795 [Pyrinomonadaceae bacterium]